MHADIDPIALVTTADPVPTYVALAAERSLRWHAGRAMWIAAHPDVVQEVLECPDCRVRPHGAPVPSHLAGTPAGALFGRFARMRDGDDHLRSRRALVAALAAIDPGEVRSVTTAQAAALPVNDPDRFAFDLPVRVVASLLGVGDAALDAVVEWARALVECVHDTATRPGIDAGVRAAEALDACVRELLLAPGQSSLLARLDATCRAEGVPLDVAVANAIGLLFQAHDATAGLIGNAIVWRARHPETTREPAATLVERVARRDPPVQNTRRFLARDAVIAGQRVAAGDTILVVLAAAGAADPDRPWTFGHGAHACPGRSLALGIASAAIDVLARRGALPARLPDPIGYRPLANARIPACAAAGTERCP